MSKTEAVDFVQLARRACAGKVGPESLSVWGGECDEGQVLKMAGNWPTLPQMTYRIWEYTDRIAFGKLGDPEDLPTEDQVMFLERGRLFGEKGGDLILRRDGHRFLWRYVGPPNTPVPQIGNGKDFWKDGEPDARFHANEDEETVLLWGERQKEHSSWFEDRVARADLSYPVSFPGRVQLTYRAYSRAGCVEFIWLTGLARMKGEA